ncbi:MAG: hypothetical protein M1840_008750 [Geoglossum simile]|nr:MAG: hypothetical protein M1840_008750 [Geoglossum simile]
MSGARHWEQDKEATVYIGNLDERVTDSLVWELMLQAGRIVNVHLPKDRVTQTHQGYGFVEFISEDDAEYAARIMNQVRLYGKPIRVNKASADKQKTVEVGAELFIGNLDPMVDEKTLYDTFSRFGSLVAAPKIARDDAGLSKGYGFVSFSNFEASDDAIANMNAQFLMNKEISVQYAYKKDGKGERHGDEAERMLAAQARKHNVQPQTQQLPPQLFSAPPAGGPAEIPPSVPGGPPAPVNGRPTVPNGGSYHSIPPPQHVRPPPQPQQQLVAPPSGLPARPPPSQAGYGGPQAFNQSYNPQQPGGYPAQGLPPPGMGAPPGFAAVGGPAPLPQAFGPPPGQGRVLPPGFGPPPSQAIPGMPPGFGGQPGAYPPGFQPHGYGRGR